MSITKTIMLAVVCLLSGLAAGWGLSGTEAKTTDIRWKYGNAELVIDLKKDMADEETLLEKIFSKDFSASGASGWLKKTQSLFHPNDPELASRLADLDYDSVSGRELRELRRKRIGPFKHQFQDVVVSFPGAEFTSKGKANGCSGGIFYGKKVDIFLEDDPDRRVRVNVLDPFPCLGDARRENGDFRRSDIQISYADARVLFGDQTLTKYKPAVAVVVE